MFIKQPRVESLYNLLTFSLTFLITFILASSGVELGQLAFIGLVFGALTAARRIKLASVIGHRALPAATYAIGILAAFWFFELLAGFWM